MPHSTWRISRESGILRRMGILRRWIDSLVNLSSLMWLIGCNGPTAYRGEILQPKEGPLPNLHSDAARNGSSPEADKALRAGLQKSSDPYLKCHFWDGTLIVLENWRVEGDTVSGKGIKYDSQRVAIERSDFHLPIATVALFETNRPEAIKSARLPAMAIVATTSVALTALCITTPKACFGSCPTIYASNGQKEVLQAEGFSSSIAKSLEATDVDALSEVPPHWEAPELRVTNEAPETHAIRSMALLYAPRDAPGRVYRSAEKFYATGSASLPTRCDAASGDCLSAVAAADGVEYKSDTDGRDLATKEQLLVEFAEVSTGDLGVVLTARNSLLNTYLFYQALAYMGNDWGKYLAFVERGDETALRGSRRIGELLGGVDVQVEQADGQWVSAGEQVEVGPLARETVMIRLPAISRGLHRKAPLHVRLIMTRGNVRLDRVGLVRIEKEVTPTRLLPERVLRAGQPDREALSRLLDPNRYLVTYPGDEYTVTYPDPHCSSCEWFVESRGYYYEWMREVWLPEQDTAQLARLLVTPDQALKSLAPAYKTIEPEIDRIFWQSRIVLDSTRNPRSN